MLQTIIISVRRAFISRLKYCCHGVAYLFPPSDYSRCCIVTEYCRIKSGVNESDDTFISRLLDRCDKHYMWHMSSKTFLNTFLVISLIGIIEPRQLISDCQDHDCALNAGIMKAWKGKLSDSGSNIMQFAPLFSC